MNEVSMEAVVTVRPADTLDVSCETVARILSQLSETHVPPSFRDAARTWKRTFAVLADGNLVGMATVMFERKQIHDGGVVAFIEDVVVDEPHRGKGYGRRIIGALIDEARREGCYKAILSCDEANVGFYEKCGFSRHEITMRMNL